MILTKRMSRKILSLTVQIMNSKVQGVTTYKCTLTKNQEKRRCQLLCNKKRKRQINQRMIFRWLRSKNSCLMKTNKISKVFLMSRHNLTQGLTTQKLLKKLWKILLILRIEQLLMEMMNKQSYLKRSKKKFVSLRHRFMKYAIMSLKKSSKRS